MSVLRFLRSLSSMGCLALRLAAAGEGPALPEVVSPDEKARAKELVKQLGDDDYQNRVSARDALRKMGAKAREALEAAKESQDFETRTCVTQLLPFALAANDQRVWQAAMGKAWPEALKEGRLSGPLLGTLGLKRAKPGEDALGGGLPEPLQVTPGIEGGRDSSLEWLKLAQQAEGRWNTRKFGAHQFADVEQTSLALLSFLGAGHTEKIGKFKENVQRAVDWLRSCQREDGAILNPGWTEVDGVAHALAGLALAEAAGMGRIDATIQTAQKAVNYSSEHHPCIENGEKSGYGRCARSKTPDLFTSALFTMQLKSAKVAGLRVTPDNFQGLIKFLDRVDNAREKKELTFSFLPGGTSSPQATFMGCLARQFLGWKREDLEPYFAKAEKEFNGPTTGAVSSDVFTNWFGTLVVFQQGGNPWKAWNEKMKKSLVDQRRKDGAAEGSWDASGSWSGTGRIFATALNSLCLQVYYRYLPLYKE